MTAVFDRDAPLPRWAQIAAILRQRVAQQGDHISGLSDQALAREFGVSPLTVRQAVQALVNDGLVVRQRGRGTFVVPKPMRGSLDHLEAFMQEWRVQGGAVRIEILERSVVAASIPVAGALECRPGQPVGYLRRLRYSDDRPVAIDYRYIPADLNELLDNTDLEHEAIWETLERKLGLSPRQTNTTIKASVATSQEARLLELPAGSPVLNRGLQLLVTGDRAAVAGHSIYHPDRFIYATTISMRGGPPSNRQGGST